MRRRIVTICLCLFAYVNSWSQNRGDLSVDMLKKLTLEELMSMEVTTLSKRPENLSEVASAIQVITNLAISRSGATRLPEALRLAPNLLVAQSSSYDWAVTARGFNGAPLANNTLANKLLVMIDGRSVYTPLFGGVFWDVQNVLLEDVERIEVVSGPGGTLWGENAVNGIINVITKSSKDTQGLFVSAGAGDFLKSWVGGRYGGKIGENLYFRVYGQRFSQDHTTLPDGSDADDQWNMSQGGIRMDYLPSEKNTIMVQGNFYGGNEGDGRSTLDGQNLLSRWSHKISDSSELTIQAYFDRTWRVLPDPDIAEDLTTYDLDFQHRFPLGRYQQITWGIGYRFMHEEINISDPLSFSPPTLNFDLLSGFVQDEIRLVENKFKIFLGSKFTRNDFSGFGAQPNFRAAWMPNDKKTVWTGITCALRSPTRFDTDVVTPNIVGDEDFDWERVLTYELGYRMRPRENLSFSLAAFFSNYDDLRGINLNSSPPPGLTFANSQKAESWGLEISGVYQPIDKWRIRGGYTFLKKDVWSAEEGVIPESELFEALDPENQFLLQSMVDLPAHFQFDIVSRYVDKLPASVITPAVPDYFMVDVRIAKQFGKITAALVGRNLLKDKHREFGSREIPRNLYGQLTWRL